MNKVELVHKIESYIPNFVLRVYRKSKRFYFWELQQIAYKTALRRVQKKNDPLNVIFINAQPSIWKYDSLFNLMLKDERFNPIVLVCPLEGRGEELMLSSLEESYVFFQKKGHRPCFSVVDALIWYRKERCSCPKLWLGIQG